MIDLHRAYVHQFTSSMREGRGDMSKKVRLFDASLQCITCSMTIQSKLANHLMLYLSSHDAIMLVEVQCQANGKQ